MNSWIKGLSIRETNLSRRNKGKSIRTFLVSRDILHGKDERRDAALFKHIDLSQ